MASTIQVTTAQPSSGQSMPLFPPSLHVSADFTSEKLDEVTALLAKLTVDLKETNLLPHRKIHSYFYAHPGAVRWGKVHRADRNSPERNSILEELKVHGRVVENADPIFTKDVCRSNT